MALSLGLQQQALLSADDAVQDKYVFGLESRMSVHFQQRHWRAMLRRRCVWSAYRKNVPPERSTLRFPRVGRLYHEDVPASRMNRLCQESLRRLLSPPTFSPCPLLLMRTIVLAVAIISWFCHHQRAFPNPRSIVFCTALGSGCAVLAVSTAKISAWSSSRFSRSPLHRCCYPRDHSFYPLLLGLRG